MPTRLVVVDAGSEPGGPRAAAAAGGRAATSDEFLPSRREPRASGPGANVGLRRWLDVGRRGSGSALCPHDALPAPDCIETLLAAVGPAPRAGLASADVGDGLSPVVDRYFGTLFRPARGHRGLGAGRLPARHAAVRPPGLPRGRRAVRRAVLQLLRGGRPRPPGPGPGLGDRPGPRRPGHEPRPELVGRRRRLPPAAQHPAAHPGALRSLRPVHPASPPPSCSWSPRRLLPGPPPPGLLTLGPASLALRDHLRGATGHPRRLVGSRSRGRGRHPHPSDRRTEPVLIDLRTRRRAGVRLPRLPARPSVPPRRPVAPSAHLPAGHRRPAGPGRGRRAPLPRRVLVGGGRLPRRLHLLHPLGLPDHDPAAGRARAAPAPISLPRASGAAASGG